MELFRDQPPPTTFRATGSPWSAAHRLMVNHRHLTAAMIDSRDFLAAKRRAETEVLLPAGPEDRFSPAATPPITKLIWAKLDQVHAKHPDMVLLHGGSPERRRTHRRQMGRQPQGAAGRLQARLDQARQGRTVQAQRRRCWTCMPIGVLVFPGTGIQDNLADKARKLGAAYPRCRSEHVGKAPPDARIEARSCRAGSGRWFATRPIR
jgi:hypothetical protein